VSKKGWTNQNIAVNYLRKFDEQTREKADGRTRVLFLDGHASHDSLELVDNAHKKDIKILAYPSHTTHILQGLDVVCFAQLKQKHAQKIREFKENNNLALTHKCFLSTFGPAFIEAFSPEMVRAAFSATGIYPFSRDVVSSEKMGPSEALSTNPPIPGILATPVRKVVSAFSYYHSTEQTGEDSISPSQTFADDMTPTKRIKILHASLGTSSSTSFLISETPVPPSSIKIHEPNYEKPPVGLSELDFSGDSEDEAGMSTEEIKDENKKLRQKLKKAQKHVRIRDQVIEANHAEIIVQNLANWQLHASLFQKEKNWGKKKNPTLDFASGRHITSNKSWAELKRLKDEREAKEMEKRKRATARSEKREKKVIEDEKWDRAKDRYEVRLRRWEKACDTLSKEEARPPRPCCRRKVEVIEGESSSCESSEDGSEGDLTTETSLSENSHETA